MVEHGQNEIDHAAVQNAHIVVVRLSSDVSGLKAELRSSLSEVSELRQTPRSASHVNPQGSPHAHAPEDIRHKTLHMTATTGMGNSAVGLRGVVEHARSLDDWFPDGRTGSLLTAGAPRSIRLDRIRYTIPLGTRPGRTSGPC